MNLFKKKKYFPIKVITEQVTEKTLETEGPNVPDGSWQKCGSCGKLICIMEFNELKTCQHCGHLFRLSAWERIKLIADENSFVEIDAGLKSKNPLNFPGYEQKLADLNIKTGLNEAIVSGLCEINGFSTVLCVMDSHFIMASMGSVVGEKVTRAFEAATGKNLPIIIFTASGGARMQEGIVSLMQMAKTSAAAKKHSDSGNLYVSFLTDPTTGGVSASFAMLGDIILAEPKATVGFAGRRVIEQTMKQKLPDEFQTAEFVLLHGFIDKIVERENQKEVLSAILKIHAGVTVVGS